jgi:hypothetical protein
MFTLKTRSDTNNTQLLWENSVKTLTMQAGSHITVLERVNENKMAL